MPDTDTEERLSALERQVAEYELVIQKAIAMARLSSKGRMFLELLGVHT